MHVNFSYNIAFFFHFFLQYSLNKVMIHHSFSALNYRLGEEFKKVLSNLFSNPFSMYLYRCVLPCVNPYLEINTV